MLDMNKPAKCHQCEAKLKNDNFFIYLGFTKQLETTLESSFSEILAYRDVVLRNYKENPTVMHDVWDGRILRAMVEANPDKILLSQTINIDGVSINQANSVSIWPIQAEQDYLPPSMRFRNKNIMLVGIYVGQHAPEMSSYLFPFLSEMLRYSEENLIHTYDGKAYEYIPVISHCVVDLQAKQKIQGTGLYNSRCTCIYCLHRGKLVRYKNRKGGYIRYVHETKPAPYRDSVETIKAMLEIQEHPRRAPISGVQKMSC